MCETQVASCFYHQGQIIPSKKLTGKTDAKMAHSICVFLVFLMSIIGLAAAAADYQVKDLNQICSGGVKVVVRLGS